jgi:hypothetical protein
MQFAQEGSDFTPGDNLHSLFYVAAADEDRIRTFTGLLENPPLESPNRRCERHLPGSGPHEIAAHPAKETPIVATRSADVRN